MKEPFDTLSFYLAQHPIITNFRWSHAHSIGSTWSFLIFSLSSYTLLSIALHVLLFRRKNPIPLGPIPALHSLIMSLTSATIFIGLLVSSAAEIHDVRWLWRRSHTTPFQWLLCFPLGTRPSGRVFFWSYAFYLTRFLHCLRTFIAIMQRRRGAVFACVFHHCALVCMSFLWLEFSQSFQVVAILSSTLAHVVVFGYRFWVGVGLPVARGAGKWVVLGCQVGLMGLNLVCHVGVLLLYFVKGGCNGIGAWVFNSVLNAALLVLFVDYYLHNGEKTRLVDVKKGQKVRRQCVVVCKGDSFEVEVGKGEIFEVKKEQ